MVVPQGFAAGHTTRQAAWLRGAEIVFAWPPSRPRAAGHRHQKDDPYIRPDG